MRAWENMFVQSSPEPERSGSSCRGSLLTLFIRRRVWLAGSFSACIKREVCAKENTDGEGQSVRCVTENHLKPVWQLPYCPFVTSLITIMPGLCALCLAVALAALARLTGSVGPVVRCEPCDASALQQCKPLPKDCAESVREPGCGCCMTCALGEGQACGVYTARCGSGLTCKHQPGEKRPLQALLEGRGACTRATKKLISYLKPAQKQGRMRCF